MSRPTFVALLLIALGAAGGCAGPAPRAASSNGSTMDPPAEAMSDTQLAAYAGHAKFPTSPAQDNWKVAAIVSADRRIIKIYNFEGQPLRTVNLWVNGAYVQPIQGVPAQGRAIVRTDKLFNALGDTFAKHSEEVSRVQVETNDGLYNLLGPAKE